MTELKFNFTALQLIEYENLQEESIENIKKWCATQAIPQPTDELIALFLLSCNRDEERTKTTVIAYYRIKNKAVEIFNNRSVNLPEVQEVLQIGYFCVMPRRTVDGCAIVCIKAKPNTNDDKHWSIRPLLKVICMMLDAAIYEYPPKYFLIIFDVKHLTLKHLSRIKPKVIKIFLEYLQEGFPSKLKAIHVINMVSILNKTIKLLKPFIKKDVWEMTKFHSKKMDWGKFYRECVGTDNLPEEYGGSLGSFEIVHEITLQKLNALEDFFLNEELHRRVVTADVSGEDTED
ncbi:hypothetical protein RN001_011325 [Aquatica leii]|uniref:CRAL-TRIO domain-containing protein n=1 Tax=Aquatica leii TaxID=1421715 RepID=A0AAN7SGL3_9COLE|nr:hypothetical protein RN001_011325 [Aquatica leii]